MFGFVKTNINYIRKISHKEHEEREDTKKY